MEIYMYNPGTRLLHLVGGCKDSPLHKMSDYKYFTSENEAIAYAGRQIAMCIKCANVRDKLIREDLAKQKNKEKA